MIIDFFNINTVFFTVMGYQMSFLEFFGTIFTVWCVWLTVREKILSWPVGIIGTILYIFLFYQIQLYSDLLEQIYFLITGFMGWWFWLHPKRKSDENQQKELRITRNSASENFVWLGAIMLGTALLAFATSRFHVWLPAYFPEAATYVFWDALSTVMSFAAQWLLAKKKVESWVLWIAVDIIAVPLYAVKGVKFVSLEYLLFLVLATKGLISWIRTYHGNQYANTNEPHQI